MLRMTKSLAFWPRTGVYDTREEAACHFIGLFGADWREYVQSIPQIAIFCYFLLYFSNFCNLYYFLLLLLLLYYIYYLLLHILLQL